MEDSGAAKKSTPAMSESDRSRLEMTAEQKRKQRVAAMSRKRASQKKITVFIRMIILAVLLISFVTNRRQGKVSREGSAKTMSVDSFIEDKAWTTTKRPLIISGVDFSEMPFGSFANKDGTINVEAVSAVIAGVTDSKGKVQVQESDLSTFVYVATTKELKGSDLAAAEWVPSHEVAFKSPREVLEAVTAHSDRSMGRYSYFSGGCKACDVSDSEGFPHLSDPSDTEGRITPLTPSMWVSSPGTTAHTHHDNFANLFFQVAGSKRFLLTEPLSGASAGIFPSHSTLARQATEAAYPPTPVGEIIEPENLVTDLSNAGKKLLVDLKPGDVLYLPPLWMHRVQTITPSVSVNFFSDFASAGLKHEDLFGVPLPFSDDWETSEHKAAGAISFLQDIRNALADLESTLPTEERVSHLLTGPKITDSRGQAGSEVTACPSPEAFAIVSSTGTESWLLRVQDAAMALAAIPDPGVRLLFGMEHVETILEWAVGSTSVFEMAEHCMA